MIVEIGDSGKELFCKRRDDMKPLFEVLKADLILDLYSREFFLQRSNSGHNQYYRHSTKTNTKTDKSIPGCLNWCKALVCDGFLVKISLCGEMPKYRMQEKFINLLLETD